MLLEPFAPCLIYSTVSLHMRTENINQCSAIESHQWTKFLTQEWKRVVFNSMISFHLKGHEACL